MSFRRKQIAVDHDGLVQGRLDERGYLSCYRQTGRTGEEQLRVKPAGLTKRVQNCHFSLHDPRASKVQNESGERSLFLSSCLSPATGRCACSTLRVTSGTRREIQIRKRWDQVVIERRLSTHA